MYRYIIVNTVTGQRWEPTIPPQTEQRLNEKMILGHFGRPAGWYIKEEALIKWPTASILETRLNGDQEEVRLDAEFTVQIVDLSTSPKELLKSKKLAIRATRTACNAAIANDFDAVEMIGRTMIAIEKLYTKVGETLPAKYATMKTKLELFATARDNKIAAIQACTTLAELETLMGGPIV